MILATIAPVVPLLRSVRIDEAPIDGTARRLVEAGLEYPTWRGTAFPERDDGETAAFFCTANVLNFSFWGDPKWSVSFRGESRDGSFGLFAALRRALEEGIPVTEGACLRDMDETGLARILRGSTTIPLFRERLESLREAGKVLCAGYGGSWVRFLAEAGRSAERLVVRLTSEIPSFCDVARLENRIVQFHKRAQLLAAMLHGRFGGGSYGSFGDMGTLTAFADYKLPQILRRFGILVYEGDLARKVDSRVELAAGSREEVEIRAATVWACELIRRACAASVPRVTAPQIDAALWCAGQESPPDARPYHRTRSIYY